MIITYNGCQFFKVQQGETIIALNPISKDSKYDGKITRFGSLIALSTTNHPDYNGIESVTHGDNIPVLVNGPGDYEVKEIFIKGLGTKTTLDKKEYINTMYSLILEGITIGFLGPLTAKPETSELEGIESPDILFVPVNKNLLDPAIAYKLAVSLEPGIIIPMDYDDASLKVFLKEAGQEKAEVVDKLTLKKKDIESKEGEIIILKNE